MEPIVVKLPEGMSAYQAAEHFTAYLIGASSFNNTKESRGIRRLGPFPSTMTDNKWILDSTNDFWLRAGDSGTVVLSCRYEGQYKVIEAMQALFCVQFGLDD